MFTKDNLTLSDAGVYYAKITNTNFGALTLTRSDITVTVEAATVLSSIALGGNKIIEEGLPENTTIGALTTYDENGVALLNEDVIYTLENNSSFFRIEGNELLSAVELDYTTQSTFNVSIKATYKQSSTIDESFEIQVAEQNNQLNDVDEIEALTKFYEGTGGASWFNNDNWLDVSEPISNWYGVETDATTGRVIGIALPSNNLTGSIPTETANLSSLTTLDLGSNGLTGEVPALSVDILKLNNNTLSSFGTGFTAPTGVGAVFNVSNNNFDIHDLYPFRTSLTLYENQAPLDEEAPIFVTAGGDATVSVSQQHISPIEGITTYSLFKDDELNPIQTQDENNTFTINSFQSANEGTYTIKITNSDLPALTLERAPIALGLNGVPSDISIDNATVLENQPVGTYVGKLFTEDIDLESGDTHTYELVVSSNEFEIRADSLFTKTSLNSTVENIYAFDVKSTDSDGQSVTKEITITVLSINPVNNLKDLEALQELYLRTNGDDWTQSGNWNNAAVPFEDWDGINTSSVADAEGAYRVTEISLPNNNLTGQLPEDLEKLDSLQVFDVQDNTTLGGSIPSSLSNLSKLDTLYLNHNSFTDISSSFDANSLKALLLNDNALDFTDLSYLSNTPLSFSYSPQEKLDELDTQFVAIGEFLALTVSDAAAGNVYQWYKDGVLLSGATSRNYDVNGFTLSDVGTYKAEVENPARFPNLTLERNNIVVIGSNSPTGVTISSDTIVEQVPVNTFIGVLSTEDPDVGDSHTYSIESNANLFTLTNDTLRNNAELTYADGSSYIVEIKSTDQSGQYVYEDINIRVIELASENPSAIYNALLALYNATDGPNWDNQEKWLSSTTPIEDWYGITLNGVDLEIDLSSNGLNGELPAEIDDLSGLTVFNLSSNELTGAIPDLSSLTALKTLDLDSNSLSGSHP